MMDMWHIVIGKEWTTPPTMQLVARQSGHTWEASRKNRLLEFLPFTLPAPTPSAKLTPAINTSPGHQHHPTQALMFLMEQSTLSPQAHGTNSHNFKHTTLHCVTRALLLYFIRSWVALSFKVVSQWVSQSGIGNTCPDLHFLQYIKAWMSSTDPVYIINYQLLPPHSVLYWPRTQLHHLVTHSWAISI